MGLPTQGCQLLLEIILPTIAQAIRLSVWGKVYKHPHPLYRRKMQRDTGGVTVLCWVQLPKSSLPLWFQTVLYPAGSQGLGVYVFRLPNPQPKTWIPASGRREEKNLFIIATRTFQELFLELGSVDTRLSEREQGRTLIWKHFTLCAWQCMLGVKKKKKERKKEKPVAETDWVTGYRLVHWWPG